MLRIQSLSKAYAKGGTRAVDDLSLEVRRGEIFGFLGPNGAGKTTTIKLICGILSPDAGSITVGGADIQRSPIEAKRMIGFVPDAAAPYDRLTGREYLNFLADVYQVPSEARAQRIPEYLRLFELEEAAGSLVRSYSRGMRQKLTLIGALLHDPKLLILDEPMTGLDPKSAHQLKLMMRARCDAGHTVFFSTHVLEVAEKLCDRIGIIHHGRLIAEGTLDALRQGQTRETLEQLFLLLTEGEEAGA